MGLFSLLHFVSFRVKKQIQLKLIHFFIQTYTLGLNIQIITNRIDLKTCFVISNAYIFQLPGRIYDNSTNHGINQNWTYVLTGLVSDTYYNLSIMAENEKGFMSQFSKPPISFRTKGQSLFYNETEQRNILTINYFKDVYTAEMFADRLLFSFYLKFSVS